MARPAESKSSYLLAGEWTEMEIIDLKKKCNFLSLGMESEREDASSMKLISSIPCWSPSSTGGDSSSFHQHN